MQGLAQPFGHDQRGILIGLVQQHGELVATEPAHDVGGPGRLAEHAGQRPQGRSPEWWPPESLSLLRLSRSATTRLNVA